MLLWSEDILLLPIWTWRGAGHICKHTTDTKVSTHSKIAVDPSLFLLMFTVNTLLASDHFIPKIIIYIEPGPVCI